MKKYIKLFAADAGIAVFAVVLYSPGLVNLRVTDDSVFRAGMSIIAGIVLLGLLLIINIRGLQESQPIHFEADEINNLETAKSILKNYQDSNRFGGIAKIAGGQLDRVSKCRQRLSDMIERKFEKGTLSWEKYYSIVRQAEASAIKNVITMSNRMNIFDEKEYLRLQHYREDDIPDDIQEQQLALYQGNSESIKAILALNEKILLKMDALAMELSSFETTENKEMNSDLVIEIEKLIEDAQYYQ